MAGPVQHMCPLASLRCSLGYFTEVQIGMELEGPVEIIKPHSLILKICNPRLKFMWLVWQSQSQCVGLLMPWQSSLPHTVLRHCHGWGGGGRVGELERAGTDGSPTEQRCLETWRTFKERGIPPHPCKSVLALNFETPVCCIEEALRSDVPALLDLIRCQGVGDKGGEGPAEGVLQVLTAVRRTWAWTRTPSQKNSGPPLPQQPFTPNFGRMSWGLNSSYPSWRQPIERDPCLWGRE